MVLLVDVSKKKCCRHGGQDLEGCSAGKGACPPSVGATVIIIAYQIPSLLFRVGLNASVSLPKSGN